MKEAAVRRLFVNLELGDRVEVVHFVKIGFNEHTTLTVGVVVKKERRQFGRDSGFERNWDDKCWFDQLTLRRDDGELTTVSMDEYTELRRLDTNPRSCTTNNMDTTNAPGE